MRRRLFFTVSTAALIAAAAVLALVIFGGHNGREDGGPVRATERNSFSATAPVARPFVFGLPIAFNSADKPAFLESARLVRPTPGLRVQRMYVAGSRRKTEAEAFLRQWPSSALADVTRLGGYKLASETEPAGQRGAELVIVLRVSKAGRYIARGVELDYNVDGKLYRRTLPSALGVCAMDRPIAELEKRYCDSPPSAVDG